MKPIAIVLIIFLATICAAGAAVFGVRMFTLRVDPSTPAAEPARIVGQPARDDGGAAGRLEELLARMEMLSDRVAELEDELERAWAEASRQPVSVASEQAAADLEAAVAAFSAEQRAAIVQIMDDVRAEQEQQREEERLVREEDQILQRAERIAREIGLSATDQKALTDHMLVAAVKRRELLAAAREDGFDRDAMREDFMELRDWDEQTMIDTFGTELAGQIRDLERSSRGFGGGRGPDSGAGPQRGGDGGGERRGRGSDG